VLACAILSFALTASPLTPFVGGAGLGESTLQRSRVSADAQRIWEAVKEKESSDELVEQLRKDEEGQEAKLLGERRPFWSSLAEQWGLLGLLVGIAVAFAGSGVVDETMFDSLFDPIQSGLVSTEMQAGTVASMGTLGVETAIVEEVAGLAAEEVATATAAEGGEALAAGSILDTGLDVVMASAIGALGGLAGVIVQGVKDPTKAVNDESRPSFFVPSATFTFPKAGENKKKKEEEEQEEKLASVPDGSERPMSAWELAVSNFQNEWRLLLRAARFKGSALRRTPRYVDALQLSNQAVTDREHARPQVPTPPPVRVAYEVLCWFIDVVFEDRPIQRFWFLETVARMPYFAYTSVLHLYETFGWWRSPELRAVHSAEENNELHHLLIMESLGGDQRWLDRFFAQHGAVAYYWLLVLFFVVDPKWSYNFSRLIEAHAVDTYGEFVDANEERLRKIPPPPIAVEYYLNDELYLFDKMQTSIPEGRKRRPPCATLYDVFSNIRDDEEQHVLTMTACEEWSRGGKPPVNLGFNFNSKLTKEEYLRKVTQTEAGRRAWVAWGEEVARAAEASGAAGRPFP